MAILFTILIFVGFIFLLISISKNRNVPKPLSSASPSHPPTGNPSTSSKSQSLADSASSFNSTAPISSPNEVVKADWNTSIFGEEAFRTSVSLYQRGMQIYQISPQSASQYFEKAFKSLQTLANKYSKNPIFYLNMVDCAMGFNYDVAITNGYKFFRLLEDGNFTFEQTATIYDISRKMYKLLIIKGNFDEGKRLAGDTMYLANTIIEQTYIESLDRERRIASYFYNNLSTGNYSVQQNLIDGLDSPEPWYKIENQIINEP